MITKSWRLLVFQIDTKVWHIIPAISLSLEKDEKNIMLGWLCFYLFFVIEEEHDS